MILPASTFLCILPAGRFLADSQVEPPPGVNQAQATRMATAYQSDILPPWEVLEFGL